MQKALPASLDAERATLGSVLLNREALIPIAATLKPDDFYDERHSWIYDAMTTLYAKRIPPDIRTLSDELGRRDRLAKIGGIPFLAGLIDGVPTSYHVEHYARIVQRTSLSRKLIDTAGKIAALGWDQQDDPENAVSDGQSLLTALQQRTNTKAVTLAEGVNQVLHMLNDDVIPGIMTGLADWDALTGGLKPGQLVVLGGRPGHGKSALSTCFIVGAKAPARIFSLEMTWEELVQRILSMESGVNNRDIRDHRLSDEQRNQLARAASVVSDLPITLDDTPNLTVDDIRSRCLQQTAEDGPLGLVVVDYIGLVKSETGHGENRATAVGRVSRGLKALAKELHAPVVLLAQLNREIDKRSGDVPEPEMSDLRESGDIEADADIVAFVVRPELYSDKPEYQNLARVYVKKHRNGETNVMLEFRFDGPTTRFDNLVSYRAMGGY